MSLLGFLADHYADSDIVVRDSKTDYSARDIHLRSKALADTLKTEKIKCFALYGSNSIDWIVADLVSQDLGVTVLPLPTFFSREQIDFALEMCPVDAIIYDSENSLPAVAEDNGINHEAIPNSNLTLVKSTPKANSSALPPNTGKVTFTSGSTGQPKGVCLSHQQQITQAQRLTAKVGIAKPKHLCVLPLSTLLENIAGVYAPLLARGQIVVPTQFELGFSGSSLIAPEKLLSIIATVQPDTLILVPQLLAFLLVAVSQGWRPPSSLKFIAVGGGKVAPSLLAKAAKLGLPVFEGYGLSECGSVVSLNTMNSNQVGSCGKPLDDIDLSIQKGEVCVSGNSMLGYVGDPSSWNKESIRTGDLGEIDSEGFLHINGRCKNVLISSFGRNISPEWVESELVTNLIINDAVVIGDDRPYCTAILSLRDPQDEPAVGPWIDAVNLKLPDYARIKYWHMTSQPLSKQPELYTENGKPKRSAINLAYAKEIETLYQSTAAA